jgi:sugar O-acyltransferase (sialic acid O-acetyltransferase NeuD family)
MNMISDIQTSHQKVIVYGASGHGKVIIDILELCQCSIEAVIDDDEEKWGKSISNHTIQSSTEILDAYQNTNDVCFTIAIGNNAIRKEKACYIKEKGYSFATVIHPSSIIAKDVSIGIGTVIMAGAVINSDSIIGEHVTINTGSTVDHDCHIGNFAHISPGVNLAGNVTIGAGSHICIGSTVIPGITIGDDVIVGAGASVIRDLPSSVTAVGVPAKIIK